MFFSIAFNVSIYDISQLDTRFNSFYMCMIESLTKKPRSVLCPPGPTGLIIVEHQNQNFKWVLRVQGYAGICIKMSWNLLESLNQSRLTRH